MARKMLLVSEEVLKRLKNSSEENIPEVEAPSLDKDMKNILENKTITGSDKLALYNQTLQRHLNSNRRTMEKTVVDKPSEKKTSWIGEIATGLPSSLVNDGITLYNWIERQKDLTWSELGELEISGHPVTGTNVVDLIYDGVRKSNGVTNPEGFEMFYKMLNEYNVPKKIIKNPARKSFINSILLNTPPSRSKTWVYV